MQNQIKPLFITFEGMDGCGKTTQINLLNQYLIKKNLKTFLTLEPGGCEIGSELRQILLHSKKNISKEAELFLYLADRAQHVKEISQKLNEGYFVLCDRFIDSTLAYQGYGRGYDIKKINLLNEIAIDGLVPNLTFIFDIDAQIAQNRLPNEKDRLESLGIEFFKKVRNGYLEIAKNESQKRNFVIIDATKSIDEISKAVIENVEKIL